MARSADEDRTLRIQEMISKEVNLLQKNLTPYKSEAGVLLTGATGSTGSYILRELIADPKVTKIYCLVRAPDARQRLLSIFPDCDGLRDQQRVVFIKWNINDPQLGISEYEAVKKSIKTIVHTAWLVNYNADLSAYQSHITALHYLLNMLSGCEGGRFLFTSSAFSIAAENYEGKRPCAFVSDPNAAVPGGYGESKFVAESILYHAGLRLKIGVDILRAGQLSGPLSTNIPWKQKEWIPILLKTSKYLKELPTDFGPVTWIPVDTCAKIVHEVFSSSSTSVRFFNVLNYNKVSFESLAPTMQRGLGEDVKLTSRKVWVARLEEFDPQNRDLVKSMPALKLLWLYKYFPVGQRSFEIELLRKISPTFRDMGPIRPEWVLKWIQDLDDFLKVDPQILKAKLA